MTQLTQEAQPDSRCGWISKEGFAEDLRVSVGTIDGWMQRHWTRGEQYVVIGRTTLINTERASEWIGQQGSGPGEGDLKYPSGRATVESTAKLSRATPITRLTLPQR